MMKKVVRDIFFSKTHSTINSVKNTSSAQDLHLQKKIRGELKWNFNEDNFRYQGP